MGPRHGVRQPRRRRWRREAVRFTVLGRFAGRDRLGKAVNLCERGLGAVFQGRGFAADQAVELQLVAYGAMRRVFGVVRSAIPRGNHTRLGIRTFGFIPADAGEERVWDDARRSSGHRVRSASAVAPGPWRLDTGSPLVSPGGVRAMERDRRELARDLRTRYRVEPGEPWDEVLRRFLDHLPHSPLRARFEREQFRLAMDTRYPVPAGTMISGNLVPTEAGPEPARDVPPCIIHLDHFAVACSDCGGRFVATGIPPQDDAVRVPLRVANHAVLSTAPVAVHLPQLGTVEVEVEVPIVLRNTAEEAASEAFGLEHLGQLVDQL